MICKLTAIIEQDRNGAFAYCPELRGCHTQGETVEEALAKPWKYLLIPHDAIAENMSLTGLAAQFAPA